MYTFKALIDDQLLISHIDTTNEIQLASQHIQTIKYMMYQVIIMNNKYIIST